MMRRTPFRRAASTTTPESEQEREQRLMDKARRAMNSVVPRAANMGLATTAAAPIPKAAPVRSEPYRRAVATLPCAICGVHGYSQAAHANQGKGMGMKRTPFKRKNNAENIQSKVAQSHAKQARVAIINIAKSAKKRAFNAVGCSESPKQSTCMRGFHA